MNEGLITKDIKASLEKIVSHCFYNNRIADRICSILSVTFVMPITSNIIHHKLAHIYPLLADDVTDYMDSRDCTSIYGATPAGDQMYDTYLDCFNKLLENHLKLEELIYEAINKCISANDYSTKVFLESYLRKVTKVTSDILLLVSKAEMYGDSDMNMMKFDADIEDFEIFGE